MSKNDFDSVKCYQCGSLFSSIDEPSTCDNEEERVGKFHTKVESDHFVDLYVNKYYPVRYLANFNIYFKHRNVLFEFHLKFWNTASISIPARCLL